MRPCHVVCFETCYTLDVTFVERSLTPSRQPWVLEDDEDKSSRKKPVVSQLDVLNPKMKGWKLGDRKDPPKLDFTNKFDMFEQIEKMVSIVVRSCWHTFRLFRIVTGGSHD
jgi:hypothetical protein